jgi:hypothetical protein
VHHVDLAGVDEEADDDDLTDVAHRRVQDAADARACGDAQLLGGMAQGERQTENGECADRAGTALGPLSAIAQRLPGGRTKGGAVTVLFSIGQTHSAARIHSGDRAVNFFEPAKGITVAAIHTQRRCPWTTMNEMI